MGTYKNYIEDLKKEWIGKTVVFENYKYKVVDIDYNGVLLIDRHTAYNDTTAAYDATFASKYLVNEGEKNV